MEAAGEDPAEVCRLMQQLQLGQQEEQPGQQAAVAQRRVDATPCSPGDGGGAPPGAHSALSDAAVQAVHSASRGLLQPAHSSSAGRYLVAAAQVPAGSTVLTEEPLAAVIMRQHRSSR
jgi:hypothetical protein